MNTISKTFLLSTLNEIGGDKAKRTIAKEISEDKDYFVWIDRNEIS